MFKKDIKKLITKAETLDWTVTVEDENDGNPIFLFSKYSPAGQDFNFSCDSECDVEYLLNNMLSYYNDFDVCEETYIWLDDTGHGTNGAPYDMKDLYNDMEACADMIYELYVELKDYYNEMQE